MTFLVPDDLNIDFYFMDKRCKNTMKVKGNETGYLKKNHMRVSKRWQKVVFWGVNYPF